MVTVHQIKVTLARSDGSRIQVPLSLVTWLHVRRTVQYFASREESVSKRARSLSLGPSFTVWFGYDRGELELCLQPFPRKGSPAERETGQKDSGH